MFSEVIVNIGSLKVFSIGIFIFLSLSMAHFLTKRMFGQEKYFHYRYPQIIVFSIFAGLFFESLRIYIFIMESFRDIGTLFDSTSLTSIILLTFIIYYYIQLNIKKKVEEYNIIQVTNMFFFFIISGGWLLCIGLFFDGHGYGIPTDIPYLGVTYNSIDSIVPYAVPIHPTQIYMALTFFVTWILISIKPKEATNLFFIIIVPIYFLVDFLKGDSHPILLGLSWTQYIALISEIIYFYFVIHRIDKFSNLIEKAKSKIPKIKPQQKSL